MTLTKWRERMNYTRQDAYRALGLSDKTYARYENGERNAPAYILLACSALLNGVPPI